MKKGKDERKREAEVGGVEVGAKGEWVEIDVQVLNGKFGVRIAGYDAEIAEEAEYDKGKDVFEVKIKGRGVAGNGEA